MDARPPQPPDMSASVCLPPPRRAADRLGQERSSILSNTPASTASPSPGSRASRLTHPLSPSSLRACPQAAITPAVPLPPAYRPTALADTCHAGRRLTSAPRVARNRPHHNRRANTGRPPARICTVLADPLGRSAPSLHARQRGATAPAEGRPVRTGRLPASLSGRADRRPRGRLVTPGRRESRERRRARPACHRDGAQDTALPPPAVKSLARHAPAGTGFTRGTGAP